MAKQKPSKPSSDYKIGYGKPPKNTQFKPGQSGNPNGRPKGKHNFASVLMAVLNEKVIIMENGISKEVTKMEAAIKQQVNRAASGDTASYRLLAQLIPGIEQTVAQEGVPTLSDQQDKEVLAEMLKRWQASETLTLGNTQSADDPEKGKQS